MKNLFHALGGIMIVLIACLLFGLTLWSINQSLSVAYGAPLAPAWLYPALLFGTLCIYSLYSVVNKRDAK